MHVMSEIHTVGVFGGDMWFEFLIGTKLTTFENLELELVVN